MPRALVRAHQHTDWKLPGCARDRRGKNRAAVSAASLLPLRRKFSSALRSLSQPARLWLGSATPLCAKIRRARNTICVFRHLNRTCAAEKSVGWEMALMRNLPFIFGIQSASEQTALYVTPRFSLCETSNVCRKSLLQAGNYLLQITKVTATGDW
jgi:hypothetical protein